MLHAAAGAAVFGASAYLGFRYKLSSAPAPQQESFPTEAERRHIFFTKADSWDRDVAFQERLLGIGRMRRELVQQAEGDVLEVAAGTGRNFAYYDKEKVRSLTVTDFCSSMLQQAKAKKGLCSYEDPVKTLKALGNQLVPVRSIYK
ncbi:methyltransferase domain-containing protein, putative [Eimeria mitis]|uniref:Methyltransferase domain-containing protein, putative n=1 Tax=Eimeria mitis TaxID=44415 RepID=U6K6J8_9EIME|nr:methyltransferase domain-containing protein, putative [Eimeria mitis]CDJ33630.1 methyltransferase domain-containing protein, putative [Eimeria mitis]